MFSYQQCLEWLRSETIRLGTLGLAVELKENEQHLPSALLRVSNSSIDAELVVWENGNTSAMVYDIAGDRYALDRHDLVLDSDDFRNELRIFFNLLPAEP